MKTFEEFLTEVTNEYPRGKMTVRQARTELFNVHDQDGTKAKVTVHHSDGDKVHEGSVREVRSRMFDVNDQDGTHVTIH